MQFSLNNKSPRHSEYNIIKKKTLPVYSSAQADKDFLPLPKF